MQPDQAPDSPREYIERCRLALDPVKAAHAFRNREKLRRWLEGHSGRELRVTVNSGAWCIDLLDGDRVAATQLRIDFDDALSHAIQTAELG